MDYDSMEKFFRYLPIMIVGVILLCIGAAVEVTHLNNQLAACGL